MKNIVNLGNVATYINGYAFKPSDWAEDGTPIIRIQDLTGNSYQMNRFKGIVDSKYDVNSGDVLISWSASLGVYVWNRGNAVLNQHIFKVVFDKEEVDKDFFVFQIDNLLKRAANQAHGATMRHLTKPVFDALPFYLPDIKTQRLISSKLNLIVHLIEDHHEQLKKLDELIRSRFVEMFGDLILNPFGWEIGKVLDVCDSIVRGPFGSSLKKEFFVEKSPLTFKVYEQKHAIQKKSSIGTYYITKEKFDELKRFECKPNDILMSCSGTIGEFYELPEDSEPGIINQALCKFTLNGKMLPRIFIFYMMENIKAIESQGSGIKNIAAVSYIKQLPLNIPPLSVQLKYDSFCQQVDKSRLAVQKSLDKLEILKKSLMQQYFG